MIEGNAWQGPNPFYLIISMMDENIGIDLDESGWIAKNAEYMRKPSTWYLIHKQTNHQVLGVIVREGDQPYYAARHVGVSGGGGGNEITAYGIGAKRLEGHTDRLWILPTGMVCSGEDVDDLGIMLVHMMGPRIE